jgi:hypothetical protein
MTGMRGDDRPPTSMFSYVSAEDRIPADHPLRPETHAMAPTPGVTRPPTVRPRADAVDTPMRGPAG